MFYWKAFLQIMTCTKAYLLTNVTSALFLFVVFVIYEQNTVYRFPTNIKFNVAHKLKLSLPIASVRKK